MNFSCPACSETYEVDGGLGGKAIRCRSCGERGVVRERPSLLARLRKKADGVSDRQACACMAFVALSLLLACFGPKAYRRATRPDPLTFEMRMRHLTPNWRFEESFFLNYFGGSWTAVYWRGFDRWEVNLAEDLGITVKNPRTAAYYTRGGQLKEVEGRKDKYVTEEEKRLFLPLANELAFAIREAVK